MRQYTAFCDDSRDYFTFEFYSDHKANSKQNIQDAKDHYRKHHGKRHYTIDRTVYNKIEIL